MAEHGWLWPAQTKCTAQPLRVRLTFCMPCSLIVGVRSDQSSSQRDGGRGWEAKGATKRGREADEYESTPRQWWVNRLLLIQSGSLGWLWAGGDRQCGLRSSKAWSSLSEQFFWAGAVVIVHCVFYWPLLDTGCFDGDTLVPSFVSFNMCFSLFFGCLYPCGDRPLAFDLQV